MNIHIDTACLSAGEANSVIAFLHAWLAQSGQAQITSVPISTVTSVAVSHPPLVPAPKSEEQAIFGVPTAAQPAQPETTEPIAETTRRTRRTKAEMEAARAAAAAPASVSVAPAATQAAAASTPEVSTPAPVSNGAAEPITAEKLRALLNGYIARHSMEDAIGQLKSFGCNRVTEALALESAKLSGLAAALLG